MYNSDMSTHTRGYTIVEILVVVLIFGLVASITFSMFSGIRSIQSLDKDAENVASYLQKARNQTVNARNNAVYSVRLATSTVTLFEGTAFVQGSSTNNVYTLSSGVAMASYSMNPATTTVSFQKMTGKPSATGTVLYRLGNDASSTRTITIHGSGLIEMR